MKKNIQIIILSLLIIMIIALLLNLMEQRKFAIKNLELIEMEFQNCYNYYKRNEKKAQEDDFMEIRQAIKHLDTAINYQENIRGILVQPYSIKTIKALDVTFLKIASSNIVSEKNAEYFFDKILDLINSINSSLDSIRFGDISKESYENIFNILEELEIKLNI